MNQRVLVTLLTVGVFIAGYLAHMWTEPRQTVPPAPAALAQEFSRPALTAAEKKNERQLDRAKLVAEIQKLRPQIEAYSTQVQEFDVEFDREFSRILHASQLEKFLASQKRWADRDAKRAAKRELLSDEDIQREQDRSMTWIYWKVTVTPRLEMLTKEYGLDATQQGTTRALLALRRNKYIALFDSTPHVSIRLSRLAPLIERVAAPAK